MSELVDPRQRASILHDLASGDEEVRRLAVELLVLLPADEALRLLAERLGDASWRVRKAAVECFASVPEDWPAADPLLGALADGENPGRRNAAVEALVRIGRRMVDALLAASDSPDVDVRKLVVDALAGIGSERSTPRLATLLDDEDANVRSAAADALAAIGGADALRALTATALRDREEPLVRFAALRGLARLEAPLTANDLASALADPLLRPVAFGALGRAADPEGLEVLLKGLESGSRATREAGIEALLRVVSRSDPEDAEALVARIRATARGAQAALDDAVLRLADADLGTRLLLAQFLGIAATPEVVLPLLRAARADEALTEVALGALASLGALAEGHIDAHWDALDGELRGQACVVLARTAGARGAARLVAALDEPDPVLRAAAASALAHRGETSAVAPLVRRLQLVTEDAEPEVEEERAALIDALVKIATAPTGASAFEAGPSLAVDLLAASFETASEPVRLAIARVLGEVGGRHHATLMALLAQDPSPAVRRAAVGALAHMPGESRSEALRLAFADESGTVRMAAAAALGAGDDPGALDALERLLCDEDAEVRAAAVRAIAESQTRIATDGAAAAPLRVRALLVAALGDRGPVAFAAVEAFEQIAPALAIDPVCEVLGHGDPEVVQSAIRCIRRHGGESDVAALIPLASHPHWAVRAGAIEALAERRVSAAMPTILRCLDGETDEFVRGSLLRALERLEEA
ncbi:MAG: HEAT-like repeat-containing protein [Deltaproteobacteria bacterium]|nr:HEAT-like repeat-containing protein [Deltaproteobacteria bacterium]